MAAWSVITGASGAIGKEVTRRLLVDGHRVLAVARQHGELEKLRKLGAAVVSADVTAPDVGDRITAALDDSAVRAFIHMPAAPTAGGILEAPAAAITAAVDVKVNGLLRVVRSLRPRFAPDACVIAVGGNLAYDPAADAATSGVANAALANAIRQLQRAVVGVHCHVVAPGPVATARFQTLVRTEAARRQVDEDVVRGEAETASPLGRLTTPEEVAWAIARLCEPEAAALAGGTLILDCGRRTAIP